MADTKFTSKWTGNEIDSGINIARNLTATGNIVITTTGSDDTKDKAVTIGTTASAAFTDIQAGTADITNISCTGITAGTADITNTLKVNTIKPSTQGVVTIAATGCAISGTWCSIAGATTILGETNGVSIAEDYSNSGTTITIGKLDQYNEILDIKNNGKGYQITIYANTGATTGLDITLPSSGGTLALQDDVDTIVNNVNNITGGVINAKDINLQNLYYVPQGVLRNKLPLKFFYYTAPTASVDLPTINYVESNLFNHLKAKTFYIGASSITGVNLTNQNNTGILNINLPSSSGTLALKSDIIPVPSSIVNSIGGVSGDVELGDGVVFSDGKLTSLVYYQYALEISAPDRGIIVHGSFISFASHEVGEEINSDTLKNLIDGGLHIGSIFINEVYRGNCYIDVDSTSNDVTVTIPNTADEAITYILNNVSTTISGKSQLNI